MIFNVEKLIGEKLEATEVSQSEIGQKQKLRIVLDKVNRILNLPPQWSHAKWSVDSKLLYFHPTCRNEMHFIV